MLATAGSGRRHGRIAVVLFRQDRARLLHLRLVRVAVHRWSQCRVPIDHIFREGQRDQVDYRHMGSKCSSLFAFYNDRSFLDIDEVDRVNGFRLAWDGALDVLRRDNRHSLDHADARTVLGYIGLR